MFPHLGIFPYEPRPVQSELMGLFAAAVGNGSGALAEAGSGTGKTVCALVPTLHESARLGKRVLYLTRTNSQPVQVFRELRAISSRFRVLGTGLQGRHSTCLLMESEREWRGASPEELSLLCNDRKEAARRREPRGCPFFEKLQASGVAELQAWCERALPTAEEMTRARERGEAASPFLGGLYSGGAPDTGEAITANPASAHQSLGVRPVCVTLINLAVAASGLAQRLTLQQCYLPDRHLPAGEFDTVISNSLLHHLDDPAVLWQTVRHVARPGAAILIMDLMRPASIREAQNLVVRYAADAPPVLQHDFYHSLRAAYRADEVRQQLAGAGLSLLRVEAVSDRHVLIWGMMAE